VFSGKEGFKVTVLEQNATPGGRAGKFRSCRLHILGDIKNPKLKS